MATATKETIALQFEIEDESTGAISTYHVLDSYFVSKSSSYTQATFATYVSKSACDRGRQPVSRSLGINVTQLPPKGQDIEQWLYTLASAPAAEGEATPSPLAGATPILAAE